MKYREIKRVQVVGFLFAAVANIGFCFLVQYILSFDGAGEEFATILSAGLGAFFFYLGMTVNKSTQVLQKEERVGGEPHHKIKKHRKEVFEDSSVGV